MTYFHKSLVTTKKHKKKFVKANFFVVLVVASVHYFSSKCLSKLLRHYHFNSTVLTSWYLLVHKSAMDKSEQCEKSVQS